LKPILALILISLLVPQGPYLGLGGPVGSFYGLAQKARHAIFDAMVRVRADFRANLHNHSPILFVV
jgi:hypothetical protein